jgi:hypothetical protein
MGSIYAVDVEPKTMYVTTVGERTFSRIGTLSRHFLARSGNSVFQLTSFAA